MQGGSFRFNIVNAQKMEDIMGKCRISKENSLILKLKGES